MEADFCVSALMDNVMIERLWRSLKYECVYLHAFKTNGQARQGIGNWLGYYNASRPHSSLDGRTPDEVYTAAAMPGPSNNLDIVPSRLAA